MYKKSTDPKNSGDPIDASRVISKSQFARLKDACVDPQFRLILDFAFLSGLRVGEISAMCWEDVDRSERTLTVKRGKGGKRRLIRFGDRLERCINELENLRAGKKSFVKHIFITSRGRMSARCMQRNFQVAREKARLPDRISFHSLRHGAAVRLLDEGVLINEVRAILGHSSVHTTSLYLGLTEDSVERLRAAM